MSWLFSQALVEAFLPRSYLATEPYAQLNVMPTPHPFWRNGKTMEPARFSRFGQTYAPLTADRGEELLTAWRAGFRARTSVSRARATGSTASGRACGVSSSGLFAMLSLDGSEWRTLQCSLLEDSESFSQTWPRSGLMLDGMCYLRRTLAPLISVSAFGSLLPTLTVKGNDNKPYPGKQSGYGLASLAVKLMPTLVARDYRHPGRSRMERTGGTHGECLPQVIAGPLNPDWCEWFMGWPVGWTASVPLAMDRFHEWRQQHSPRSALSLRLANRPRRKSVNPDDIGVPYFAEDSGAPERASVELQPARGRIDMNPPNPKEPSLTPTLTPALPAMPKQADHALSYADWHGMYNWGVEMFQAGEAAERAKGEASAKFTPTGRCTCAGPDGPCEACIANREAYEEWQAERALRPSDDALWDQTLRERDNYHEWADKLAEAISRFIGFDIGEHSSVNNPWARAIDMVPAGTLAEALAPTPPSTRAGTPADPDKALEFAEYMAKGAEQVLLAVNRHAQALSDFDDMGGENNLSFGAMEQELTDATESLSEYMTGLRDNIYEFRKRRDRALATRADAGEPLRCDGCGKTIAEHDRLLHCPAALKGQP